MSNSNLWYSKHFPVSTQKTKLLPFIHHHKMLLWVLLVMMSFHMIPETQGQQEYVNNRQLDCDNPYNSTFGNVCNSVASCQSYLTFKSSSPEYNTPSSISYLLNSTPSLVAKSNNISDVDPIVTDTMVTVPVNCSCSGGRYQHNASYTIKVTGETYFTVANNTYEALTTCQALIAQNPYDARSLVAGVDLRVPLRCACPTKKQSDSGFKYLLTYIVSQGESVSSIAEIFGVDTQSVLDANELTSKSVIFYFTPLLIPLKQEPPARIQKTASPPPPPPPPAPTDNGDSSSSKKWVIVGVSVGVAVCLLVALLVFFLCFYNRRRRQPQHQPVAVKDFSDSGAKMVSETTPTTESWSLSSAGVRYATESLTAYKFEELQNATGFFSEENRIKGSVYRASFKGDDAAVKILNGDVSAEINLLKMINHANIIRLSGFCVNKGNTYLVYEFAENDSLDDWLHSDKKYKNSVSLSWMQRVQIAYDVADALNYLHNYTNPTHIHKNLKSGNILLDGKFRAKVSNFGLARSIEDQGEDGGFQMTRHVVGTQGYMPPEYIENGLITPKMDVFAFGVVILELLSGREATGGGGADKNNGSGEKLLSVAVNHVLEGDNVREKLRGFMDPTLRDEYPLDLAYSMAEIAKRCVAVDINSRPNIAEVLMTLSKIQSSSLDWDPSDELERSKSVSQISETR